MAAGGMQRGLYGRAESPYNANFLPAAYASGSSNGAGVATAANFAAFGLGEETWSSGRSPASNNGLTAYTPSRGVISMRGNWPLIPTMDVVVPYARSMSDLLGVLGALVNDDTRASVIELWEQAARDLEALGAEVIEVDFPVVSNYERDRPGAESMIDGGLVPKEFADAEMRAL
jgi:amidase